MSPNTERAIRAIAIATGIGLPTLTLVPLGGLWLYQNGYVLHWALAILVIVGAAAGVEWWWLRKPRRPLPHASSTTVEQPTDIPDPSWSSQERRAWAAVQEIASAVKPERLSTRDEILALGIETIRTVALVLHEGRRDPHLQFTLPEALAIVEQVSRRLGAFVAESVPLGDRLTVAHIMTLYRWRGAVGFAERAYDVWRLIRLANPVTAATSELRERLTRQLYEWGRDHVVGRIAETYILEIGRAAIDLYSGRIEPRRQGPDGVADETPGEVEQPRPPSPASSAPRSRWGAVWSQTRRAGRTIGGTLFRRGKR